MKNFYLELNKSWHNEQPVFRFISNPGGIVQFDSESHSLMMWGDPLISPEFGKDENDYQSPEKILSKVRGHFYFLLLDRHNRKMFSGNSTFSILPLYFGERSGTLFLSNNINEYSKNNFTGTPNKRFVLENLLFNYPLFNLSPLNEVNLLPANNYMVTGDGKIQLVKHFRIEEHFTDSPVTVKHSASDLADLFIEISGQYMPEEEFFTSLTGGFDGRTLLACALYHKKRCATYCFGTESSSDIILSRLLSKKSGIEMLGVDLGNEYITGNSKQCGEEFIYGSSGTASFSRAHYIYAARILSERRRFLITGNFGSEVLRAPHSPGVVIGEPLFSLIRDESSERFHEKILNNFIWQWLRFDSFREEWQSLEEDIQNLSSISKEHKCLTKNQRFYILLFEEVFRKYFGAEIVNQIGYINNRTPFLDVEFIKFLLKTEFAGVNSEFGETNPLKRYKGQLLYAEILKRTSTLLYKEKTDKGYSPESLIAPWGKPEIAMAYIARKLKIINPGDDDPHSVNRSFKVNMPFWADIDLNDEMFDRKKIIESVGRFDELRDNLFILLSQVFFKNRMIKSSDH